MTLCVGRMVLVRTPGRTFNGSDVHPAIVVCVHSETMINCRVFTDSDDSPLWVTSAPRADAAPEGYTGPTWHWPVRE